MAPAKDRGIELLCELGLNQLEAEVYAFLLPREPMTAYAIGSAIARPTANVYKAIERLARAGAVLVEEGANRLCRAVPVKEFLRHTERDFVARRREAEEVLGTLVQETFDERVYRVESVGEALERCREMLARAKVVAVVDAFPRALEAIAPAIAQAARRGVEVVVEAYAPTSIAGADVVVVPEGQLSLDAWRSEQLNVVVDGREHLLALLSQDLREVYQAVWSRSVYLSCLHHSGRMTEITLVRLLNQGGPAAAAVRDHPFFRNSEVPGHRELVRRFTRPPARSP
jgi:sugar-specific transcriptional regulator TrmB